MTSMLVLLFLYFGYIALARASPPSRRAGSARAAASARVTAIFALVGAVNLPIINRSGGVVEQPASGAEHHHARLDDRQRDPVAARA
jgi:hypothetical protein